MLSGGAWNRAGVEGEEQWWGNRAMERPPGPLASGDYWATPAVGPGGDTAPLATIGRRREMDDTTPKLQFVRLHLGKCRMDVVLHDPVLGDRRLVRYEWHAKEATDVPPEGWYNTVLGEVRFQRGQEFQKKTGRFIPRG